MEIVGLIALLITWLLFRDNFLDTFWEDNGEPLDGFEPQEHNNESPDSL